MALPPIWTGQPDGTTGIGRRTRPRSRPRKSDKTCPGACVERDPRCTKRMEPLGSSGPGGSIYVVRRSQVGEVPSAAPSASDRANGRSSTQHTAGPTASAQNPALHEVADTSHPNTGGVIEAAPNSAVCWMAMAVPLRPSSASSAAALNERPFQPNVIAPAATTTGTVTTSGRDSSPGGSSHVPAITAAAPPGGRPPPPRPAGPPPPPGAPRPVACQPPPPAGRRQPSPPPPGRCPGWPPPRGRPPREASRPA